MAPIVSVNIKTRSLSAEWDGKIHRQLLAVVDQGLEHDGYIVLTLDDKVSLAAQGAQLKFSKLVHCQEPSVDARFVKQLEYKTLLDRRHGEPSFLGEVGDAFAGVAEAVLRVCMHTVGMPSNALAGCLDDPEPLSHRPSASLLQAISYSGRETVAAEAHVDRGLLTVVWDDAPGLQVQSPAGEWQPITLKQNQVAVFAGEMLQHATCGRIKAAVHRVVLDPAAYQTVGGSSARVSLAFKQRPAEHAVIDLRNVPGFRPDARFPHPLVVAHATALFEADHRSVNEQLPGARQQAAGQLQQSKRARHKGGHVPSEMIRILVATLTGKYIKVDIAQDAMVKELAELVQAKEGIPPDQQRFIFHGVRICAFPSRTLADLDIHAGDVLHLILKLCGD